MDKFHLHKSIYKKDIETKYGLVTISNIEFNPIEIENYLPEIVFEDENLKFMFQYENLLGRNKLLILQRFVPNIEVSDISNFISNSIKSNKTFYSFLAEGMLGLVFRDIFGYELSVGIIDVSETLSDTHSGADVCMFDRKQNILVLGEAKFYEKFKEGIDCIITDFTKKRIFNKLDSFKRMTENNDDSWEIILKNLKKDIYDEIKLPEFMQQKMIFAGFVLHGNEMDVKKYLEDSFYDNFQVSTEKLKSNINSSVESKLINIKYEIVLFHLPVNNKKDLIEKIINKANLELKTLRGAK